MLKYFWRRNRRHFSIVVLLPLIAPVFMVLGASLIIAITISSSFPPGSAPSGNWVSIFAQNNTGSSGGENLELLSKNQIEVHRQNSQTLYLQTSHFNRQVRHENNVLDSRIAFVNPEFFSRLGIDVSLQELKASQAVVRRDFAIEHQIDENDVLVVGEMRFRVAGVLDNFHGLDRRTDVYFPIEHLDNAIYHEMPEHLRELIIPDLPLFFYAEQVDRQLVIGDSYEDYSLTYIEGIIYAPGESDSLRQLNHYIFSAAIFLCLLFVLTDFALSNYWVQQRQGELALMATVGATNTLLMGWFLKKWLLPRMIMLFLICLLLPSVATSILELLGFGSVRVEVSSFLKSVAVLTTLYAIALAFSAHTLIRNLKNLSGSLRNIRSSTRRNFSRHLQWAGAALLLLVVITTALFTTIVQFQQGLAKPDHMNSKALYAVIFKLAPGYQVDSTTLQRRTQTVRATLQHFANRDVRVTATNTVPMREPIYSGDLTSIGGRSLRHPIPVSVANVDIAYQELAQHALTTGKWPRSLNEIAVNEALLRKFGLRLGSLPELWLEGERYQVTAIVKDSYWLDPLSLPKPIIWRPISSPSSNLLVHWSKEQSVLEEELLNIISTINNGIILDELISVDALRAERMRLPYILLNVLIVVSITTMAIALGCLWVAINSWLTAKKWPLTVHLALGATTSHLRQQLLTQVVWPLLAFLPLGAAVSLYITTIIDHEMTTSEAFQTTIFAFFIIVIIVFAIVANAHQRLLALDAASLTKDVT